MANSSIQLVFDSLPALDTEITIEDSLTGVNMTEVFKNSRTQVGETSIMASTGQTAVEYSARFYSDYNNTSLYSVVKDGVTITITALNPLSQFTILNTTGGAVLHNVRNVPPTAGFSIDSITVSEATINPCDNVKLTITTNEQADTISSPLSQVVSANPFIIDVPRQDIISISMVKDGVTKTSTKSVPKLLASNFNLDLVNTPSSASLTVTNTYLYTPLFSLEYSIDNVVWQTSNHFNSLPVGNYTIYIKDDLGCSTSKAFTIDSFTPNLVDYDALAEVSNLNPIRYKEVVTWSEFSLKTPYNTLSFEENVKLPNLSFTQPFNKTDLPKTQIKTNYTDVSAKIIDSEGAEIELTTYKLSNNMNITDVRDAVVLGSTYNGLSYTSVKFSGGNIYDPITLAINGDYNIGDSVPTWLNAGDYVNVQGAGWYKVLDIIFSVDAYVLVLNLLENDFPLSLGTFKITSVYNAVDFERYEFTPSLTNLEGYYKIQIDLVDTVFGTKTYLSEWLNVKTAHLNTALIEYYNTENNEINFNTGFTGVIRIPLAGDLVWKANTEQEIYVTDTNTVNLESKYRGFWDFSARPLPTMMSEKLALILLQDRLFINQVNYLAEDEVDSNAIGSQYQIKASLVKANYVFNGNSGLGIGEVTLQGTPLMISEAGGFLLVE